MGRYRKKPVVVDAFQWIGDWSAMAAWLRVWLSSSAASDVPRWPRPAFGETLLVPTLEGEMRADKDDWIIRGVRGEFYPCKPDIFAATYEVAQ